MQESPKLLSLSLSLSWIQVILDVTLINVTLLNKFLLNSYFENPMVKLHVLYAPNIHVMVGLHFYMFFTHIKLLKTNFPLQINLSNKSKVYFQPVIQY